MTVAVPVVRKKPRIYLDRIKWIENYIRIKGNPYRFGEDSLGHSRRHLYAIHKSADRPIVLFSGRQIEKTSNIAVSAIYNCWSNPYFNQIYVSSSQAQTSRFSGTVIKPMLQESPLLDKIFYRPESLKDNVLEKHFSNKSKIFMAYAFLTADRVRGISADSLFIDEMQDILLKNIHVIEETLSHSKFKRSKRIYSGTPKTFENPMEHYWSKLSTQNEWTVPCDACGNWNILGLDNIGKKGLVCNRKSCRRPIDKHHKKAMWVRMGKKDAEFEGFRISQLMVPWMEWSEILSKFENYNEQEFCNEVLGLSADRSNATLKKEEIMRCCTPDNDWPDRKMVLKKPNRYFRFLSGGVDWGKGLGSYTVAVVGGYHRNRFEVIWAKKYDPQYTDVEEIIEDIAKSFHILGVGAIGSDWGAGFTENNLLQKACRRRGTIVIQFYSTATQKMKVRWNNKSGMYTINRTETMSDVFQAIKTEEMAFPRWEDWEEFARDFLCIFADYHDRTRMMYYNHPAEIPDDAMHATNYAYLVSQMERRYG